MLLRRPFDWKDIYNRTKRRALFGKHSLAQLPGNDLTRDPVPQCVPVSIANVGTKPVKKSVVLIGICLQLRRERDHGYSCSLRKIPDAIIRIKKVVNSD